MKLLFYITLIMGGLVISTSKDVRVAAVGLVTEVVRSVGGLVIGGGYAEIRSIDGEDFDEVIRQPNRVIIVVFHNELRASSRSETRDLDEAVRKLPGDVLVAKVAAEENGSLLRKLHINELPAIRVYQAGRMVRGFSADVAPDELVSVVHACLDDEGTGSGPGYIGPMDNDWMPDGVLLNPSGSDAPMSKFE